MTTGWGKLRIAVAGCTAWLLAVSTPAAAWTVASDEVLHAHENAFAASPVERVWPMRSLAQEFSEWRRSSTELPPLPSPLHSFALSHPWALSAAADVQPGPPKATLMGWIPSVLLLGAFAGLQYGADPPKDPRWSSRNSFDDGARNAFKGESKSTRRGAKLASDVIFGGMAGMMLVDWWWLRKEHGLARSIQVDTRWAFANLVAMRTLKVSAGRERPYVRPCRNDDDYVSACDDGRDRNASFFSGHASGGATIAGLLCARHLSRRKVGAADWIVCGGATAGALTTGFLRMTAENHFMTDVLTGWAVGFVFGYVLPRYFDYGAVEPGPLSVSAITPVVGRDYYGLRYGFRF